MNLIIATLLAMIVLANRKTGDRLVGSWPFLVLVSAVLSLAFLSLRVVT